METLILEELKDSVQLLSPVQCDFLSENCIVAFEKNNHTSGCVLRVIGDNNTDVKIAWSKMVNTAGYKEEKKIIEHAAETMAFLLSSKFTEYKIIEEGVIGTGFDYWLGYDENHALYNPRNFIQARLEISGINSESSTNTLQKRVRDKKQQTDVSDGLQLPAYISVTEFTIPKSYFGKK